MVDPDAVGTTNSTIDLMCIYKLGGLVQQLAEGRERGPAPDAPDAVDLALEVHRVPGVFS